MPSSYCRNIAVVLVSQATIGQCRPLSKVSGCRSLLWLGIIWTETDTCLAFLPLMTRTTDGALQRAALVEGRRWQEEVQQVLNSVRHCGVVSRKINEMITHSSSIFSTLSCRPFFTTGSSNESKKLL